MGYHSLTLLVIRLAGLGVIVSGVTSASSTLGHFFADPKALADVGFGWLVMFLIVSVGVPTILGLLLIKLPSITAHRILKIEADPLFDDAQFAQIQHVAFAVVGLWLLSNAFLDAVYALAKARFYNSYIENMSYQNMPPLLPDEFAAFVTAGVQFVLGLILLLGSRGISKAILSFRNR